MYGYLSVKRLAVKGSWKDVFCFLHSFASTILCLQNFKPTDYSLLDKKRMLTVT